MPYGEYAAVSFAVANALVAPSAVHFQVDNAERPADAVEFTVSRDVVGSWEGPTLCSRARVKLGDDWIPAADLIGGVEIEDIPIDSHTGGWSFQVLGKSYSLARTQLVFARTPVEVWLDRGEPGAVIEAATPTYAGYVLGCDQTSRHVPLVTIRCGDEAAAYEEWTTCDEFEPLTGMTRLEITENAFDGAGIPGITGPSGGVYDKPLQWVNKRLFEVVKQLWEPVGGRLRPTPSRTFEIWVPAIKTAPQPPDYVWTKSDIVDFSASPPEKCPSRYVVTGSQVVISNELGLETELNTVEIESEYAPKVAVSQQAATTGTITATGASPETAGLRVTTRIDTTTTKRNGQILTQTVTEWGWKNLRAALWVANNSAAGSGTAPSGFTPVSARIDEEGAYVHFSREKFMAILRRELRNTYSESTLVAGTIETHRWFLKEAGVRNVGTAVGETDTNQAYVFDDDQSYSTQVEQWGLAERQVIALQYADTGAQLQQQQDTYRYQPVLSRIDGSASGSLWIRYDGRGQNELVASWKLGEIAITNNITNVGGHLQGTREVYANYTANPRVGGAYDFGDFSSDAVEQSFQTTRREAKELTTLSETQYEEVEYPAEGGRISRLFAGTLPIVRFEGSVWTSLRMQPYESVVDDATALDWWGFQRETVNLEHAQNLDEALAVIRQRRRRAMARKYEITRIDHAAVVGDTVRFVSYDDGINDTCIVVAKSRSWSGPLPMASYSLEAWS
jgi:hypothetical protein